MGISEHVWALLWCLGKVNRGAVLGQVGIVLGLLFLWVLHCIWSVCALPSPKCHLGPEGELAGEDIRMHRWCFPGCFSLGFTESCSVRHSGGPRAGGVPAHLLKRLTLALDFDFGRVEAMARGAQGSFLVGARNRTRVDCMPGKHFP